jgi:hypothetical protein
MLVLNPKLWSKSEGEMHVELSKKETLSKDSEPGEASPQYSMKIKIYKSVAPRKHALLT